MLCAASSGPNPNPNGVIYALDEFNKAIYVYDNALGITGGVAPSCTMPGTVNTTQQSHCFNRRWGYGPSLCHLILGSMVGLHLPEPLPPSMETWDRFGSIPEW